MSLEGSNKSTYHNPGAEVIRKHFNSGWKLLDFYVTADLPNQNYADFAQGIGMPAPALQRILAVYKDEDFDTVTLLTVLDSRLRSNKPLTLQDLQTIKQIHLNDLQTWLTGVDKRHGSSSQDLVGRFSSLLKNVVEGQDPAV